MSDADSEIIKLSGVTFIPCFFISLISSNKAQGSITTPLPKIEIFPSLTIPDGSNLNLKTFVNEEERQNTNTNLMIYDCFTLVEYLSTAFTLMPGDLVPTGTPEGSALSTQNWLKPGDRVKVEIENIGFIENNIIQEPKSTTKY